jgi:hypothetical protein
VWTAKRDSPRRVPIPLDPSIFRCHSSQRNRTPKRAARRRRRRRRPMDLSQCLSTVGDDSWCVVAVAGLLKMHDKLTLPVAIEDKSPVFSWWCRCHDEGEIASLLDGDVMHVLHSPVFD